jgi:ribA/ribD-fused uncharacterized protein
MIDSFDGEYRFLSNFYLTEVEYEGMNFPSSENAFQAAKTLDTKLRQYFLSVTPSVSKRMGRALTLRPDWEKVKVEIMAELLDIKFRDPVLRAKLLATGDQELVEGNWWHDTFWGVCNDKGENHLGKLLMELREKLTREAS